jgi:hypothetical protein
MNKNRFFPSLLGSLLLLNIIACHTEPEPSTPPQYLYAKFQAITAADTLHIGLDSTAGKSGEDISATLFLAAIDSSLFADMIYEPDTFDFQAQAHWKVPLDKNYDACLLGMQQAWFKFKYLLIYSKSSKSFVDLLPAAYLFGGDGGQIVSESWIFDLKTKPTVVSPIQEHYMRWLDPDAEEPQIIDSKDISLLQWSDGTFEDVPIRDSSRYIRIFPSFWE